MLSRGPGTGDLLLAVLSGVVLGIAFLPAPLGWLAWAGFIPLLAALERRVLAGAPARALFGVGYLFGLAFYLVGIHWIALLSDVAITVPWLKYPAWIAAASYLALFSGLATLAAGWLARRSGATIAATFPLAWLALEELRASGELGFPWFQPGYTQHDFLPLLQMASLGSVTLVTLWLLFLNVLLWRALFPARRDDGGARARAALGVVLALALPWAWGVRALQAPAVKDNPAVTVALVQGNIPGEEKWSGRHQRQILDRFLRLSDQAARSNPRPDVIIWPETATGSYLRRQLDQALAVTAFCARTGIPVLSGFPDYRVDSLGVIHPLNAAGLFLPDGSLGEIYAKRHLVPFGERMPFQGLLPALGKLELGQAEWMPGTRPVLFPSAAGPFSCLVCFEAIFPDLSREDVRHGARWLVNITNDEWFGNGAALHQHAAMAVFRAAENHVPMARCANTGLTILVDAHGGVTRRLPVFEAGVLKAWLPPPGRTTLYTRVGDWPGLVALVAIASLAIRRRRRAADLASAGT